MKSRNTRETKDTRKRIRRKECFCWVGVFKSCAAGKEEKRVGDFLEVGGASAPMTLVCYPPADTGKSHRYFKETSIAAYS